MYATLQFLEIIAIIGFLTFLAIFFRPIVMNWLAERGGKKRDQRISSVPTYEHDDEALQSVTQVRQAQKASLQFLGLPSVHAGQTIMNVPTMNPDQAGEWAKNRQVLTATRILALLKQGQVPGDLIELFGGYALFASNGKSFLLTKHLLTTSEEMLLEKERKEAVEKGDPLIPNFQGVQWRIGTACGEHKARHAGEKTQSTIQVLSIHPELGKNGQVSFLPSDLLNGKEHDYYDMRAREIDGSRVMLFMYVGGVWLCLMGRELTDSEARQLRAA